MYPIENARKPKIDYLQVKFKNRNELIQYSNTDEMYHLLKSDINLECIYDQNMNILLCNN